MHIAESLRYTQWAMPQIMQREGEPLHGMPPVALEAVFLTFPDAVIHTDVERCTVACNAATTKIFGWSLDELIGRSIRVIYADERDFEEQGRVRYAQGASPELAAYEMRYRRKDGTEFWGETIGRVVNDASGALVGFLGIIRDVTERRRWSERMQVLASATAALAASLDPEGILDDVAALAVPAIADACTIELRTDDGTLRYAGAAPASAARTDLLEDERIAVKIATRDGDLGLLTMAMSSSGRRFSTADAELCAELGTRVGLALENARLLVAAKATAQRAEEASRLGDEFLATVSHELRTPLNAILGWSTVLRREPDLPPNVQKAVRVIHRNAQLQVRLVDDILDVSRVVTGQFRVEPRPMDLVSIVREALDVVRASAEARAITIELDAPEPVLLVADPGRVRQVAWNLLSNAVKFSNPGSRVAVVARHEGTVARLVVRDEGRGIAPEFLPFVFERFRQADGSSRRSVGGLGLGLAIVRHIVELHGGCVRASSDGVGKGSTFVVELPIRDGTERLTELSWRPPRR